jgi:hypothetical protein
MAQGAAAWAQALFRWSPGDVHGLSTRDVTLSSLSTACTRPSRPCGKRHAARCAHCAGAPPALVSLRSREDRPECLVAQVVNESLRSAVERAEASLPARLDGITLAELPKGCDNRLKAHRLVDGAAIHRLEDHHGRD